MTYTWQKALTVAHQRRDKERSSGEVVRWSDVPNDLICKQALALSRTIRHNYQGQAPLLCLEPISQTLTKKVRW